MCAPLKAALGALEAIRAGKYSLKLGRPKTARESGQNAVDLGFSCDKAASQENRGGNCKIDPTMRSKKFAEPRSDAYSNLERKKNDHESNIGWIVLLFSAIRKAVAGEAENSRPWKRGPRGRHPAPIPQHVL